MAYWDTSLNYQQTPPLLLRTLDGIHLASALTAKTKEVITTDQRMGCRYNPIRTDLEKDLNP